MLYRRLLAVIGAIVIAGATAGCAGDGPRPQGSGPTPHGDSGLTFFVRNETDRIVVVVVDGLEVLRVEPGGRIRGSGRLVLVSTPPPNTIEVRTVSGHVFGSFRSDTPGQFDVPGFVGNTRCGDVWVWLERDVAAEIAPVPYERQPSCE